MTESVNRAPSNNNNNSFIIGPSQSRRFDLIGVYQGDELGNQNELDPVPNGQG
jgi:hypothetical protein